jgi:hypothetical protein
MVFSIFTIVSGLPPEREFPGQHLDPGAFLPASQLRGFRLQQWTNHP